MTATRTPVIEIAAVSKDYHGLRPLRIEALTLARGEHAAILGMDRPMAETFVNLVTGATLPDRGVVTTFGRPTSSIDDSAEWLDSRRSFWNRERARSAARRVVGDSESVDTVHARD